MHKSKQEAIDNANAMLESLPRVLRTHFETEVWNNGGWCSAIRAKHLRTSIRKYSFDDAYSCYFGLDSYGGHSSILGDVPNGDTPLKAFIAARDQVAKFLSQVRDAHGLLQDATILEKKHAVHSI